MKAKIISIIIAVLLVVSLVPLTLAPAGAVAGTMKLVTYASADTDGETDTADKVTNLTDRSGGFAVTASGGGDTLAVVLSDADLNTTVALTGRALTPVDGTGTALSGSGTSLYWKPAHQVNSTAGPTAVKVSDTAVSSTYYPPFNYFILASAQSYASGANTAVKGDYYVSGDQVANTTTVTVSAAGSISVTLTETGVNTNIFRGAFQLALVTVETDSPKKLQALHGSVVTVAYADASPAATVSKTITVDTVAPTVSSASPADAAKINTLTPSLTVNVTDALAGLAAQTATPAGYKLEVAGLGAATTVTDEAVGTGNGTNTTFTLAQAGGTKRVVAGLTVKVNNVTQTLTTHYTINLATGVITFVTAPGNALAVTATYQYLTFVDKTSSVTAAAIAGGSYLSYTAVSGDSVVAGANFWRVTGTDKAGNAATATYTFTVDQAKPTASSVQTGYYKKSDGTVGSNSTTSLGALFSEALNATTVDITDFLVSGNTVTAVAVGPDTGDDKNKMVFLTLGTAIAPDAKPAVQVVSAVSDVAGNAIDLAATVSFGIYDAIKPTWTATITPTTAGGPTGQTPSTTAITVTIQANETISTGPYAQLKDATGGTTISLTLTPSVTVVNTWTASASSVSAATSKTWKLQVYGADTAGNSNGGTEFATATDVVTGYSIDNALDEPEITLAPAGSGTADTAGAAGPWTAGNVESQSPTVGLNFDEAVTVSTATLTPASGTAVDVSSSVSTANSKNFSLTTSGLTLDKEYTLAVSAKDALGNTVSKSATFTPKKTSVTVALVPGWNLISVPRALTSMALADVLTGITTITKIYTYDAATLTWSAIQYSGGTWAEVPGLPAITNFALGKGYLVNASSATSLALAPKAIDPLDVPPTHSLVKGWNLLGYTTLTLASTSTIDTYLNTLKGNWGKLLKFTGAGYTAHVNTSATSSSASPSGNVDIGKGYWIYMSNAAELAP